MPVWGQNKKVKKEGEVSQVRKQHSLHQDQLWLPKREFLLWKMSQSSEPVLGSSLPNFHLLWQLTQDHLLHCGSRSPTTHSARVENGGSGARNLPGLKSQLCGWEFACASGRKLRTNEMSNSTCFISTHHTGLCGKHCGQKSADSFPCSRYLVDIWIYHHIPFSLTTVPG